MSWNADLPSCFNSFGWVVNIAPAFFDSTHKKTTYSIILYITIEGPVAISLIYFDFAQLLFFVVLLFLMYCFFWPEKGKQQVLTRYTGFAFLA